MFASFYSGLITLGTFLQPFILLAIRLFWGWEFFDGGLGKLKDINPVIEYFGSLGIPFPTLNAYLVGSIETVGGLCLLLGFASRLAAIPLMCVMGVALFTAYPDVVTKMFADPLAFTHMEPFNFLLASLLIFAFGPGYISIDALLKRFVR